MIGWSGAGANQTDAVVSCYFAMAAGMPSVNNWLDAGDDLRHGAEAIALIPRLINDQLPRPLHAQPTFHLLTCSRRTTQKPFNNTNWLYRYIIVSYTSHCAFAPLYKRSIVLRCIYMIWVILTVCDAALAFIRCFMLYWF